MEAAGEPVAALLEQPEILDQEIAVLRTAVRAKAPAEIDEDRSG